VAHLDSSSSPQFVDPELRSLAVRLLVPLRVLAGLGVNRRDRVGRQGEDGLGPQVAGQVHGYAPDPSFCCLPPTAGQDRLDRCGELAASRPDFKVEASAFTYA